MGFCVGHVVMRFNSFSFFLTFFSRWRGDDCARADFNSKNYSRGWKLLFLFFFSFLFSFRKVQAHTWRQTLSTHLTGSLWSDAVTSASNPIAREGSLNLCCYTQLNDLVVDELSRNWSHNSHTHTIVSPSRRAAADVHWLVSCNFHHLDLLYTQLRSYAHYIIPKPYTVK